METGSKRRRRLLHACGISALTIAHKACGRAEEVHGPIGSLVHKMASLAEPIVNPIVSQSLAILAFADDRILAAEDMVETFFPSSALVFDKIESFVLIPDTLSEKFDLTVDVMTRRVPFLQLAFTILIWGLNFLLSLFSDWGSDDSAAKEKEIMVDINCNEIANNHDLVHNEDQCEMDEEILFNPASMEKSASPSPAASVDEPETLPIEAESKATAGTETERDGETVKQVKSSYKEVLEMGISGDEVKKEGSVGKEEEEETQKKNMENVNVDEEEKPTGAEMGRDGLNEDLPILELFDAGWRGT